MSDDRVVVAAAQATPVFLDRDATVARVVELIHEAGSRGARLVVFPEAFVPGYPDWVWRTTPSAGDEWFARLVDQALVVPSPSTDAIGQAAAGAGVVVALGADERDAW